MRWLSQFVFICLFAAPCLFSMEQTEKEPKYTFLILGDGEIERFSEEFLQLFKDDTYSIVSTITKNQPDKEMHANFFLFFIVDASKFKENNYFLKEEEIALFTEAQKYYENGRRHGKIQILFTGLAKFDNTWELMKKFQKNNTYLPKIGICETDPPKISGEADHPRFSICESDFSFLPIGFTKDERDLQKIRRSLHHWI